MAVPVNEISERLKKALIKRNTKPIELSEKTGIPKSAISHYMSGYAKPKDDRIYLISKALDINEAWLLGYDVQMDRKEPTREEKMYARLSKYIELFESLDDVGQDMAIANMELIKKVHPRIIEARPLLNAAHADDYANAPEELKKQEEDIMDDENF